MSDWVRIAMLFAPALILWPVWHDLRGTLGIEGAALIAIAMQLAAVAFLTEPVTDLICRWLDRH